MLFWILLPALTTVLGGLCIYLINAKDRIMDLTLAFAAGVMLAATSFSLLIPAIDQGTLVEISIGFICGILFIASLDHHAPHIHERFKSDDPYDQKDESKARRGWLIFSALFIHNIPEGMAVGVAFAAGGMEIGIPLALAIAIQNFPEGFSAAAPLLAAGYKKRTAFYASFWSGIIEPVSAGLAFLLVSLFSGLLSFFLAFAASAMLYVVVDEMIPEVQERGRQLETTLALLGGFLLMMCLDVGLS